jgi:iron(II)-dependent oxidoreductase
LGVEQQIETLREARRRTLELIDDLDDDQMVGPRLEILNPLRWEIGHVAWFQEYWLLRHVCGRTPLLSRGDALYDSAKVAHDTRWDLMLPSKAETITYLEQELNEVEKHLAVKAGNGADESQKAAQYFLSLTLFHEDMHDEAITYTRQTLGFPPPRIGVAENRSTTEAPAVIESADAMIPAGSFLMGNTEVDAFAFDNERPPVAVNVEPFAISRTATSNGEYLSFISDDGYRRREFWSEDGWRWRESVRVNHPLYWKFDAEAWQRRNFNEWVPLETNLPVLHVNWYEAQAYCRWAGRRLPTEAEWEWAACGTPNSSPKRRFPWGNEPPTPARANLDSRAMGSVDVKALPAGDSAFGCRQMIGNVWEWTASDFLPYPGFAPGPYKEYSAPWFGDHKVLRGGCWVTRSRLIHNTYRNFYRPDRRDVWAGFRTCAI